MKILAIDLDGKNKYVALLNKKKEIILLKNFEQENNFPKADYIVTGISPKNLLKKKKKIETKKNLKKIISFQEKAISFFDEKKSIINTFINNGEVSFYITSKKEIKKHLEKLEKIKVDPDFISSTSQAQIRFFNLHFPKKEKAFLIHLTENFATMTIMEKGELKNSYFIKVEKKEDLLKEIYKFSYSFKEEKIDIFFSGNISKIENIKKEISKKENYNFLEISKKEILPFAISIGLCLDVLSKKSLNFRKKEFISKRKIKNLKIFNLSFFILALFFSFSIYLYSNKILKKKEENINRNLSLLKKIENIEIKNLNTFFKKIKKEAKYFPYFPLNRKVSSILEWIYSNEFLKKAEIVYLDYKLSSYPSLKYPNKKYKTEVFLKIKTKDREGFKKFKENLSKEKIINSKIKFSEEEDLYKISFCLKPLKLRDIYEIK